MSWELGSKVYLTCVLLLRKYSVPYVDILKVKVICPDSVVSIVFSIVLVKFKTMNY